MKPFLKITCWSSELGTRQLSRLIWFAKDGYYNKIWSVGSLFNFGKLVRFCQGALTVNEKIGSKHSQDPATGTYLFSYDGRTLHLKTTVVCSLSLCCWSAVLIPLLVICYSHNPAWIYCSHTPYWWSVILIPLLVSTVLIPLMLVCYSHTPACVYCSHTPHGGLLFSYPCLCVLVSYPSGDLLFSYLCLCVLFSYPSGDLLFSYLCVCVLFSYPRGDLVFSYPCWSAILIPLLVCTVLIPLMVVCYSHTPPCVCFSLTQVAIGCSNASASGLLFSYPF
jgi:hypothetical protein